MLKEDKVLGGFAAASAALIAAGYPEYGALAIAVGAFLKAVWPAPKQ
jgi:hypothetical protein